MPVLTQLAEAAGVDENAYWHTLQQMCGCKGATKEQFLGLLMQAQKLGLDPIQRQLFLMETKKGPQVIVPIDGYLTLMLRNPDYLSHEVIEERDEAGVVRAITAVIHRKAQHNAGVPPFRHTEYMSECARGSGPWQSHPYRMLKHKAMSQAVRYAFGVYVPDANEWERADDVARPVDAEVSDGPTPAATLGPGLAGEMDALEQASDEDLATVLDADDIAEATARKGSEWTEGDFDSEFEG